MVLQACEYEVQSVRMHNRLLSGLAVSTLALAMWAVAQEQPQQQQVPLR
jgi:hypothetical protein